MRTLEKHEVEMISGGAPADPKANIIRADPATDVNGDGPGKATGWCRGFGNLKASDLADPKHDHDGCGVA